jgi:RNA polymerase sigma-70 factor (ECF subfamily)
MALYERNLPAVRTVVADRVRCPDLREDVTQEAFTRALERLAELRRPDQFRPWLLTIARNAATDRWRLEQRQMGVDPEVLGLVTDPAPRPDDHAALRLLVDEVERGIQGLSERDALALGLVSHLDLAPAEVGAALGVTQGAAKVAVHRARCRLRASLDQDVLVDAAA